MRGQYSRQRNSEAAKRSQDRREREDSAERLHDVVPRLSTLALELHDTRGEEQGPSYTRRVVVERAPALFDVPCMEPECKEGGHEVTAPILRALRAGQTRFEGEHTCDGQVGRGHCGRVLRYVGLATFTG
jgi:hypothetical protein